MNQKHAIRVEVKNKIATSDKTVYVCDNSDYEIDFSFDAEWNAFDMKTARFTWDGNIHDEAFTGNRCPVPIISDTLKIYVGVFAGNLCTTTPAFIVAERSILSSGGTPAPPRNDVYHRIIQQLDDLQAVTDDQIHEAVRKYLEDNSIEDIIQDQVVETENQLAEYVKQARAAQKAASDAAQAAAQDVETNLNNQVQEVKKERSRVEQLYQDATAQAQAAETAASQGAQLAAQAEAARTATLQALASTQSSEAAVAQNANIVAVNTRTAAAASEEATEQARVAVAQASVATQKAQQAIEAAVRQPIIRNGNWWCWNAQAGDYTDTGVPAVSQGPSESPDVSGLTQKVTTLEQQMADLLYVAINISAFSHNAGTKEMGSKVTAVVLSWTTNKMPTALTLDDVSLDATLTTHSLTGLNITANKTWTLKATDERGAVATKTATVSFYNGVYYGAMDEGVTLDSAAVLKLSKKLQSGKSVSFTQNVGDNQRLCYACPSRYGTPKFVIGGFEYEWTKTTIDFTNASGYTEKYDIWRHSQLGGGSLTVSVS